MKPWHGIRGVARLMRTARTGKRPVGIPADPILDIMRRSLINLEFIDRNYEEHAVYEITQLMNTFLGAFIHPSSRILLPGRHQ